MGVTLKRRGFEPRLLVMCECRDASTCPSVYNDSAPVKNLRRHYIRARIFKRTGLQLLAAYALLSLGISEAMSQESPTTEVAETVTPEAHLSMGYDALKVDQYDVAVREFRAALTADPALSLRARFPRLWRFSNCINRMRPGGNWYLYAAKSATILTSSDYLGRLDLDDHKYADAVRNLKLAAVKPPFPDTAYFLGYAYFKQGDLPAAEKWLTQATQLTPRDARVPYQLGLVYRKLGREQEATQVPRAIGGAAAA